MEGFIVKFSNGQFRVRPLGERAWRWAAGNFQVASKGEFAVRPDLFVNRWRAILAENLELLPEGAESRLGDFEAQREALRIAKATLVSADRAHDVLGALVKLRNAVVTAADPRSMSLLGDIDRHIRKATEVCRSAPGWPTSTANRAFLSWLQRMSTDLERAILRTAISIVLTIDVWRFLWHR